MVSPPGSIRRALRWLAAEGIVQYPRLTRAVLGALFSVRPAARLMGTRGARLARYLPAPVRLQHWRQYYPPANVGRGEVGLFLGCVARAADQRTIADTVRVLTTLGYGVHVPARQGC